MIQLTLRAPSWLYRGGMWLWWHHRPGPEACHCPITLVTPATISHLHLRAVDWELVQWIFPKSILSYMQVLIIQSFLKLISFKIIKVFTFTFYKAYYLIKHHSVSCGRILLETPDLWIINWLIKDLNESIPWDNFKQGAYFTYEFLTTRSLFTSHCQLKKNDQNMFERFWKHNVIFYFLKNSIFYEMILV